MPMFRERLYYLLKPAIPWHLRLALRRRLAAQRRVKFADSWPIDPCAGARPVNWPGWPRDKQFALVLTHDVEGSKGLSRVEKLMELEQKHGFRSCINFVPQGEYKVPDALRKKVAEAGFEVGLHGLEHDGRLYASKASFARKAGRIREYAKNWDAHGFRSPLMQHRLGWLHALDFEYDASTFDTDPFEPESDGVRTIFPFWVPAGKDKGYVELPYTLVQDFTLFVVLREQNIDIWKDKLDWIAKRGGMALINTHPDYMSFGNEMARDEYSSSRYEEILRYIRSQYDDQYWAALPLEVSRYYCAATRPEIRNTRKKICMVAYTFYELDNRVRRYAETLAKRGDHVDVIALSSKQFRSSVDNIEGVTVHRIQYREYDESGKWAYAKRLTAFLTRASLHLRRLHELNRYDVVHVHNMPDFLVFAAWYPKLTGAKLILDIHDIVPELFVNKFKTRFTSLYAWTLRLIERLSARFVDHVIVSNDLWQKTVTARSVSADRCSVFVNHVDLALFSKRERTRKDDRLIVLFPGSLQWHQGLDIAIRAFAEFKAQIPNAEFHIYSGGGGDRHASLEELSHSLGLADSVKFFEGVSLDEMPQLIANVDMGVVPKRADSFGNEAYSTKIMEFMSQGIPVVASKTKIDSYYFANGEVRFFQSGDSHAMARAMLDVARDKELAEILSAKGYAYAQRNGWDTKKQEYLDLVDVLSTEKLALDECGAKAANPVDSSDLVTRVDT
jgi:glycosyltransferase involved in cell wall biosynthesis/peptidoglycan/xylan/chitin deacetylase (PgdA/CDA1 family)